MDFYIMIGLINFVQGLKIWNMLIDGSNMKQKEGTRK